MILLALGVAGCLDGVTPVPTGNVDASVDVSQDSLGLNDSADTAGELNPPAELIDVPWWDGGEVDLDTLGLWVRNRGYSRRPLS